MNIMTNRYDNLMSRGKNWLAKKEFKKACTFFELASRNASNNNELTYALRMQGKAQYYLKDYKRSEITLAKAYDEASDEILKNHIGYDLAIVNLRLDRFWIMHDDNLSWFIQANGLKKTVYFVRTLTVSLKKWDKSHLVKILSHPRRK